MDTQIGDGIVAFGNFRCDVNRRSLLQRDSFGAWVGVAAGSRAVDVLAVLLRQPGALVTKDAIMGEVWPGIAVEANNLTVQITALRKLLDGRPPASSCIQTVVGRGYRFVAPVRRPGDIDPNVVAEGSAAAPATGSAQPAERRQITVMACDLPGLAALSGRLDLEDLREVTEAWRRRLADIIEQYRGTVATYAADGVVAYFGYPEADEHAAERAVRAGLALVDAVPKLAIVTSQSLSVRIGIATGLVVVGDRVGPGAAKTITAVGSTPHLAASLQALAAVNQIIVAGSTRELLGRAFDLTDLGETVLPGATGPVRAWRVERALVTNSRFDARRGGSALTPLVGREEELELLLGRWREAKDGEGRVVLLSGEPGIGKSRILDTLRNRLEMQGVQALRLQCSPYHENSAFWPFIDFLERTLVFGADETAEGKLDKLEALIVAEYGRPLADVRFVAAILSVPCEDRYGALPMTPQKFKDETLRTLVDLVEASVCGKPSVMLFEDLQWVDPTTQEVLDLLIDRVRSIPLLVVLTHRPEFQSRRSHNGHVGALTLSKLSRTQCATMVAVLTDGKALPAALAEQIVTRTDGVPLFVEELTKSILESDELKEAGDHYEYAGSARTVTIPATLRDSLMARLDRFVPVKEIAQIGAAIGREFSYELIAAVAPMAQAQLDDSLAQLGASGLAFRRGTPPDAVYTFKHALVQDAAYDSLLKSRRQELHAKIARVIETRFPHIKSTEPEVLAHHLTAGGLTEAAIPLWQAAGELALQRLALAEAIAHLNQGLELVSTLPHSSQRDASELGLRTRLGSAWLALKGHAAREVWTSLHPALVLAKSLQRNDALAPIFRGLTVNIAAQGRVAESLPWVKEMLEVAETTGDADLLIAGHVSACTGYNWSGEFIKVLEHANKVLDLYDAEKHCHLADILHRDPKTATGVHASISTLILGYPDKAFRLAIETDAHARSVGRPFELGWVLFQGLPQFDHRFSHEDLRERAHECERLGRENSLPLLWAVLAPLLRGLALMREGKPAEAIIPLKASLALWEASGGGSGCPTFNAFLAEATVLTGDLGNGLQLTDKAIEQVERPGWEERIFYAEILRLKGWVLSLKGDPEGAERNFRTSLDWARRQQAKMWELRTATSLARLWQSQGNRRDGYELLAPVYDWFTEGFDTKDLLEAKALLDELRSRRDVARVRAV